MTATEIKAAYRKAAQLYHPDRPTGDQTKFNEATKAKDVLLKALPCETCQGSGVIRKKEGYVVVSTPCPNCWRL